MARLRLFAALREAAGESEVEIPAKDVADLIAKAIERYPAEFSDALGAASVLLNGAPLDSGEGNRTPLEAGDEVALLPPVSGGAETGDRAATGSSARLHFSPAMARIVVFLLALLASWLGQGFLVGTLAILAAASAAQTARESSGSASLPAWLPAVLAGAFPIAAQEGEEAFLIVLGGAMLVLGTITVIAGAGANSRVSVPALASTMSPVLLTGLLISYLVLIRQMPHGADLIFALWVMVAAYHLAAYLASRIYPSSGDRIPILAGLLICPLAGLASLVVLNELPSAGPLLVLGLLTGAAAALGQVAGALVLRSGPDQSPRLHLVSTIESLVFAAPAFYYGFHLYLT